MQGLNEVPSSLNCFLNEKYGFKRVTKSMRTALHSWHAPAIEALGVIRIRQLTASVFVKHAA